MNKCLKKKLYFSKYNFRVSFRMISMIIEVNLTTSLKWKPGFGFLAGLLSS